MARLEIEIGGNTGNLDGAVNKSLGILGKLQQTADKLNIELFKAQDVTTLAQIGEKLTGVNGLLKSYTDLALKSNDTFRDNQAETILDALDNRLRVVIGNTQLFGESIKAQQNEVKAYSDAINRLLSAGLDPTDSRITSLKKNIDALNASMAQTSRNNVAQQFQNTGRIIPDLENKIKRLRTALSNATDTRSIVQYNIRLRNTQTELERLRNLGVQAATSNQAVGNAMRSLANAASSSSRGMNMVSLELGRVIQDAPFAANNFGAIGNNITRIAEVLPMYIAQNRAAMMAQYGTASSSAVLRASLAGLVTGWSGITLAISLAVSAYTLYQQRQQRLSREQKQLKDETVDFADTLAELDRARLKGDQSAQKELTNLRLLYTAYRDTELPIDRRRDAYARLQEIYPEYFSNMSFEEANTDKVREAYDKLTNSLITTARARAAANIMTQNSEKQLEAERKLLETNAKLEQLAAKEAEEAAKIRSASYVETAGGQLVDRADREIPLRLAQLEIRIQKERQAILEDNAKIADDYNKFQQENIRLEKEINKLIAEGAELVDKRNDGASGGGTKETGPLYESPNSVALAGLEGLDLELEKIRQKYLKFYDKLSEAAKKKGADLKEINRLMLQAEADERVEANEAIRAEEERIASEIARIRTESGIRSAENKQREILSVLKWYDEEVRKARGNAEILIAVEEGKYARLNAIHEKYLQQRLDTHERIRDKIQAVEDRPFRFNESNSRQVRRQIEEDLRKRLELVRKYYAELRKLHQDNPWMVAALGAEENTVTQNLENKAAQAASGDFYKELSRATTRFGRDFYNTLTSINQMADATFEDIFSKIVDGLNGAMDEIFLNHFQKKLAQSFDKASEDLGSKLQGAIAGVGLAGGILAGVTNKTSGLGQGAGKGLQGAASGAMVGTAVMPGIGTAIGAGIGAIAGALSGIFSAKRARRQEELQQQQLLEAQKQTKLLERQNALAYTSSIIGRMTTEGVVTGVEINEFGQLTTKISGQDLLVVLDRANSSRLRGT